MLKIDLTNTIDRHRIFTEVCRLTHEIANFAEQCFNKVSYLNFGDVLILSDEGVQQGDSLAPLLFCVGIHELLRNVQCPVNIGYLDEITLFGTWSEVEASFAQFTEACSEVGLTFNVAKCEVTPLSDQQPCGALLCGLHLMHREDATLLGGALGGRPLERQLETHAQRLTLMQDRLELWAAARWRSDTGCAVTPASTKQSAWTQLIFKQKFESMAAGHSGE